MFTIAIVYIETDAHRRIKKKTRVNTRN